MHFTWEDDSTIRVELQGDSVLITANRAGLRSLASHLTTLANGEQRDHYHLDEYNSLEDGSTELIVELIE